MKLNTEAKQLTATLPALGTYTIPFYKESAIILEHFGAKELQRLDRVDHLGITSKIFTGASHSRLEYTLLQCAIINLLPKFHKDDEKFAISNTVKLSGVSSPISSGEELLKSWALLSNFGHMQFTYGPERALLQYARSHPLVRQKLLQGHWYSDIRRWCENVIDQHIDTDFHYVLILYRICQMPKRNKTKGLFMHMLRHLLLPIEELPVLEQANRYKIYKLRRIYAEVRQLCIVALDAYYSHQPIRYQIAGAIIDLNRLLDESENKSGFPKLLRETAGWLAEEIYLHPKSAAILRQYEFDAYKKLDREHKKLLSGIDKFDVFFRNAMHSGFGEPKVGQLLPFLRFSFPAEKFLRYSPSNLDLARVELERKLTDGKTIKILVMCNSYTLKIHIDFLTDATCCNCTHIFQLYKKLYTWLSRRLEAEVQWEIKQFPKLDKEQSTKLISVFRPYLLEMELNRNFYILESVFESLISFLLPEGYSGVISEYLPMAEGDRPIRAKFQYYSGETYDNLSDKLAPIIEHNPSNLPKDRIHELKTLLYIASRSKAKLIIACTEKFLIKDRSGKRVDDWDGVILEISEDVVTLKVIEAKNGSGYQKVVNEAFEQLAKTRDLITSRHKVSYKRERISKKGAYGAYIEFRL